MTQRNAFILATALTAFVLVLIGGVASGVAQGSTYAAPTAAARTAPGAGPEVPLSPQTWPDRREAAYRELVQQANERIQQANDQLRQAYQQQQSLAAQLAPVQGQTQPARQENSPSAPPPGGRITAEQAVQVASAYLGGGTAISAKLEREHGVLAYEVEFADGSEVYVDAGTGQAAYAKLARGDRGRRDSRGEQGRHEEDDDDDA